MQDHHLPDGSVICRTRVPDRLQWDEDRFSECWTQHPLDRHQVVMFGKPIQVPRWQQAFGVDYEYTGSRNNALQIRSNLQPLLSWSRQEIDPRLNGLLVNWYDGPDDYIGPHHDSRRGLVADAPIVTISFGETRIFRLERGRADGRATVDLEAPAGTVFVMPAATNLAWKHSVPARRSYLGRRISVTIRAFVATLTTGAS